MLWAQDLAGRRSRARFQAVPEKRRRGSLRRRVGAPVDTTYFPNIKVGSDFYFWTSKGFSNSKAIAFHQYYGSTTGYQIYISKYGISNSYNVMCVRGNTLPNGIFKTTTIGGDSVVRDTNTGLMWQKTYKTGSSGTSYCENLTYAGYSDWRLPNINELASLLNYDKSEPPYSDFPGMPSHTFWSSTKNATKNQTYDDYSYYGSFIVSFGGDDGSTYNGYYTRYQSSSDYPYMKCVRSE